MASWRRNNLAANKTGATRASAQVTILPGTMSQRAHRPPSHDATVDGAPDKSRNHRPLCPPSPQSPPRNEPSVSCKYDPCPIQCIVVHVLHAFQKKSQRTSRVDIAIMDARLKSVKGGV
jgi:hypothetical protein